MKLFELAYCCRLYGHFSGFDVSLNRFRERTAPALDPDLKEHRAFLFEWLNSWGCRQFAKDHHVTTASDSLTTWARLWLNELPPAHVHLTDLSAKEVELSAAAYEALTVSRASFRLLPSGRSVPITFGATGAAKTLFALRPNIFPPWDEAIRTEIRLAGVASSFREYLTVVADQLRQLAIEAEVAVAALPELVDRPDSSPAKLIDEYNWVVMARGCPPPTPDELLKWSDWAGRSQSCTAEVDGSSATSANPTP
jgi:hypothetical protein